MILNIRRALAAMLSLALTATLSLSAVAQEDELDVAQAEPMTSVAEGYGKDCCKGCDSCCGGSFYAEAQFVYLDSYDSYGYFDRIDSEAGYRLVGSYQACDGLGARVRYFDFDSTQLVATDEIEGLDLWYIDAEVTDTFCICNLHGTLSAGYRHAELAAFDGGTDLAGDITGDGVTFGLQVEREISCNLGLFAWAQHSLLYGDSDYEGADKTVVSWLEFQAGAQYNTCLGGYNTVVRGGVEAQNIEELEYNYSQVGLLGWFLSAGVTY